MLPVMNITNVFNACQVLFGPEVQISIDFLRALEPSGLKSAYRRKAFETHPDRATVLGESEAEMNRRFKEVIQAYQVLSPVIKGDRKIVLSDEIGIQRKNRGTNAREKREKGFTDHFFKGYLPKRKLMIGQFLYYSGFISWKTLIEAIIWQRKQRPLIGQIARQWGFLSSYDVQRILLQRSYKEKFGEYALRKGYITPFQLMALIGKQRRLQRPIGEYFIERGILSPREMDKMIERVRVHNIHNIRAFWTK
ncbi:MAG: hypothetical protein DRH17_00165 [Deltaproteobacteria bacterium]|nr:MAG: hypothetical protein DRH17_00165 [Deltaproteobacteria bacterium]